MFEDLFHMIKCPKCETEFEENELWDNGSCPGCGKEYYWDEIEDDEDSWPIIDWRSWDEL
jgi:Zn finger protein HypA/HybF involved in hydrogenase expression